MRNVVKNIILFLVIFAFIYSQEFQLSIGNVNEQHGSFDLLFDTQVDVQGFELNIDGLEVISVHSEFFSVIEISDNGYIIGLSLDASPENPSIPAYTQGVFASLQYHLSEDVSIFCINSNTIKIIGTDLSEINDVSLGDCHEISWNGITLSFGNVSVFQQGDDYMRKLDVNYASYHDIPGFQMTVDGITLHDAYSEDIIVEINEDDGIILGVSTSSQGISSGIGTLFTIEFEDQNGEDGSAVLCFNDLEISNWDALPIDILFDDLDSNVDMDECIEVDAIYFDCAGTWDGNLTYDECGVCGGDGIADGQCDCDGNVDLGCGCGEAGPSGCNNECGSDLANDECGVCGGDNSSCDEGCGPNQPGPSGCDNQCGSDIANDECGVCGGDNSSCTDCAGVPNGDNLEDNCGVCDDDSSNDCVQDCAGIWGGSLDNDECGVCGGDNSSCDEGCGPNQPGPSGCDNQCGSDLANDECGVCGGDNSSCTDCAGVPNGDAYEDECGTCDDDSSNDCVEDCAGTWGGSAEVEIFYLDSDGDGFGFGDGYDLCNAFIPDNWVTNDDDLEPDCSTNDTDECGVCGGENSSCDEGCGPNQPGPSGCDNQCGSDLVNDECGVCGGDGIMIWDTCYSIENTTLLDLPNTSLIGEIPPEIGNLINLTYLNLASNSLIGEIPPEIGDLINLTYLNLNNNELTGEIPSEIGNLINLNELWLSHNQLSGEIPLEVWSQINLNELWLSNNQLSGEIPSEIGSLANLTILYLSSNELTGEIPSEIGNLTNLTYFDLHSNQLTGEIPPEIGNLTNLTYLSLSSNELSGEIPEEICIIHSGLDLLNFWINNNNLCPPYPECIENEVGFQDDSYCGVQDCAGTWGGDLTYDECGVCGGGGIADGECDCEGNVDLGCGCGEPGPSGCDETCESDLELTTYCFDNDGDGLGLGGEMEFCWEQALDGWVDNCDDIDDACDCSDNDNSCYDCSGMCGGDLVIDECGECGGDGIDEGECDCVGNVLDCINVCGGSAVLDECGVCDATYSEVPAFPHGNCACDGVVDGTKIVDECGDCVEPEEACLQDCLGEWGGNAYLDECNVCDENPLNDCKQDCSGEWGGELEYDDCGYCEQLGNGEYDVGEVFYDCNEDQSICEQWGNGEYDDGEDFDDLDDNDSWDVGEVFYDCNEDQSICAPFSDGEWDLELGNGEWDEGEYYIDVIISSTCIGGSNDGGDCSNGNMDCPGVCGGDNSTCYDGCGFFYGEDGLPNTGDECICDECGICDADATNDNVANTGTCDCAIVPNGNSYEDECGTCDDDPSNDCLQDCSGEWGGDAVYDQCGLECAEENPGPLEINCLDHCDNDAENDCLQDCSGEWGGSAEIKEYCFDGDGDGLGDPSDETYEFCNSSVPSGMVGNCDDEHLNCQSNMVDCTGLCDGNAQIDDCGDCWGEGTDVEMPNLEDLGCGCNNPAPSWYCIDLDLDGFGSTLSGILACNESDGYSSDCSDQDDDCASNWHDCLGVCDGEAIYDQCGTCDANPDNDCEWEMDLGCGVGEPAPQQYCADLDYDGLGNPDATILACTDEPPTGYVEDCSDPEPHCATNDTDDCGDCGGDSFFNEDGILYNGYCDCEWNLPTVFCADFDEDGLGDPDNNTLLCVGMEGWVSDCSDLFPSVNCLSNVVDCEGTCDGDKVIDGCVGICNIENLCEGGANDGGDCTSDDDCPGVCGGEGESCTDCNDQINPCGDGSLWPDCDLASYLDECEECVGGSTEFLPCSQDCNGEWGGPDNVPDSGDEAVFDECGYCEMTNGEYDDGEDFEDLNDNGIWDEGEEFYDMARCVNGSNHNQECNVDDDCPGMCGGDNSTCQDCLGIPNGDAYYDECGLDCLEDGQPEEVCIEYCNDDPEDDCLQDCLGDWGGELLYTCIPSIDDYGEDEDLEEDLSESECGDNGWYWSIDGSDECGVCNGDGTSCHDFCDNDENGGYDDDGDCAEECIDGKGDVNFDGSLDIMDLTRMISHVLNPMEKPFTCLQHDIADFDEDGYDYDSDEGTSCLSIDVVDLINFVHAIINGGFSDGMSRTKSHDVIKDLELAFNANVVDLNHYGLVALDMTLEHGANIVFDFNEDLFLSVCEPISLGQSRCMVIADQSGNVLKSNMPFKIIQVSAANQSGFMNVHMHSLPLEYVIGNAYPNPFNPVVSFDYFISNSTNVEINAYDLNGRKISNLINGHMEAGNHVIQWDASSLPSGIYFIQFDIESQMEAKKVILLK